MNIKSFTVLSHSSPLFFLIHIFFFLHFSKIKDAKDWKKRKEKNINIHLLLVRLGSSNSQKKVAAGRSPLFDPWVEDFIHISGCQWGSLNSFEQSWPGCTALKHSVSEAIKNCMDLKTHRKGDYNWNKNTWLNTHQVNINYPKLSMLRIKI